MRVRSAGVLTLVTAAVTVMMLVPSVPVSTQGTAIPRTKEGKPNFTGIWQVMNTANWDVQAHEARRGPVVALGAAFGVPPGTGVVVGNEIPYLPEAAKKKRENGENWLTRDPEIKCFMPGIPRATYMPYPFQIVQSTDTVIMAYEFANASRIIRMNNTLKSPAPAWMGWSVGRWDGETLEITVIDQVEDTWFDRAGNFHSEALKVVERYSFRDANTIDYDVTIEDPKVFSHPWKMNMPIYRRLEKNAQLMEYRCVPFVEELMYGHLRRTPAR
jgi:hypothetical protein